MHRMKAGFQEKTGHRAPEEATETQAYLAANGATHRIPESACELMLDLLTSSMSFWANRLILVIQCM